MLGRRDRYLDAVGAGSRSYHPLRHVNQADGERGCAPISEWGSLGGVSLLWMQAEDVPPQELSDSLLLLGVLRGEAVPGMTGIPSAACAGVSRSSHRIPQ